MTAWFIRPLSHQGLFDSHGREGVLGKTWMWRVILHWIFHVGRFYRNSNKQQGWWERRSQRRVGWGLDLIVILSRCDVRLVHEVSTTPDIDDGF